MANEAQDETVLEAPEDGEGAIALNASSHPAGPRVPSGPVDGAKAQRERRRRAYSNYRAAKFAWAIEAGKVGIPSLSPGAHLAHLHSVA
eukprot:2318534-Ditylum_brightwellii.AAC.1